MTGNKRRPGHRGGPPDHPLVDRLIAEAVTHHQAGRWSEAEDAYWRVLAMAPGHDTALYHLGIVALQTSRFDVAIDLIGRAVALDERNAERRYHLALAHQLHGRLQEAAVHYSRAVDARPDYAEAHTNLGNTLKDLGRLGEAAEHYLAVLQLRPGEPEPHYNLANVLAQQSHLPEAITHYRHAVALNPNLAEAHTNLGLALMQEGKPDEAAERHRRALVINPRLAEARVNLGMALRELGQIDEAAAQFESALAMRPSYAEAHHNLGVLLMALGRASEARTRFQQAVTLRPDFLEARRNLLRALLAERSIDQALMAAMRLIEAEETAETRALFMEALQSARTMPALPGLRDLVLRALNERWGRPGHLVKAVLDLAGQDPAIGACFTRAAHAKPAARAGELIGSEGLSALARDELLRCLLRSARTTGLALERLLADARALLLTLAAADESPEQLSAAVSSFFCALAQQCFINNYVFGAGEAELEQARAIRSSLAAALSSGGVIPPLWPVAIAAYFPLYTVTGAEALLDRPWPEPMAQLIDQQVRQPLRERALAATIPALTAIDDGVSKAVRAQYEESPYPVWVAAAIPAKPLPIHSFLSAKFPFAPLRPRGNAGSTDVLIAGCGTGQQVVETALQFENSDVLAIDLSLASLSYAKRQTEALGLTNIEYAQADILKLDSVGRTFDAVIATGVLHHMTEPASGLQKLLGLLRPDGFVCLGLYSELARREVVAVQQHAAARGFRADADGIRSFRRELMELNEGSPLKAVMGAPDFFSTSECRDLLFHVKEHRMTLPEVRNMLAAHGLEFLGFEIEPAVRRDYAASFPDDKAMTNLDNWHAFETQHPHTFLGMYQFWAQRRG
jgi:tetratricopeptide (TPR) repeat protein/SAM-dependent methyltransferase